MSDREQNSSKRTTIYDLAKLANTSPTAVSSILNGTWKKRRISKRLAEEVTRLAEEQGYSTNIQASLLRRARSNIVGMIVPKYDNRYFGDMAERFEAMARERGLFPVVTCTQRNPDLEMEAAKELLSFQAETLIATGATDPDRITALCKAAGVTSINLDLPGSAAPSIISDNYAAARALTEMILDRCAADLGWTGPLHFVGGRMSDHNTLERLRGFRDAQTARGITPVEENVLARGYSADQSEAALEQLRVTGPMGLFVNSTISLEGVMRWITTHRDEAEHPIRFGTFDWDPFGAFLPGNVGMARQDVGGMLAHLFALIENGGEVTAPILVPCSLEPIAAAR